MKKNRGVTIISLAVYVVTLSIIVGLFTLYIGNYAKNIASVSKSGANSNEFTKLYAIMIKDIKNANFLYEYSDSYLKFDTDVEYEVVIGSDRSELFRDGISVASINGNLNFDYYEGALIISCGTFESRFLVGRGY